MRNARVFRQNFQASQNVTAVTVVTEFLQSRYLNPSAVTHSSERIKALYNMTAFQVPTFSGARTSHRIRSSYQIKIGSRKSRLPLEQVANKLLDASCQQLRGKDQGLASQRHHESGLGFSDTATIQAHRGQCVLELDHRGKLLAFQE